MVYSVHRLFRLNFPESLFNALQACSADKATTGVRMSDMEMVIPIWVALEHVLSKRTIGTTVNDVVSVFGNAWICRKKVISYDVH